MKNTMIRFAGLALAASSHMGLAEEAAGPESIEARCLLSYSSIGEGYRTELDREDLSFKVKLDYEYTSSRGARYYRSVGDYKLNDKYEMNLTLAYNDQGSVLLKGEDSLVMLASVVKNTEEGFKIIKATDTATSDHIISPMSYLEFNALDGQTITVNKENSREILKAFAPFYDREDGLSTFMVLRSPELYNIRAVNPGKTDEELKAEGKLADETIFMASTSCFINP